MSAGARAAFLLLTNGRSANPFGNYLSEILRAEGLNLFDTADVATVDLARLRQFSLAVLAEMPLDYRQVGLLQSYVSEGGHLIAMRPDARLAPLLGVERVPGMTTEGYVLVDTSKPAGRGIASDTLQFHGEADNYRLAGAELIAWLYRDANTPTSFPAVAVNHHGRGKAAMWAFDLARSVAYTRQGNPARANQERDGLEDLAAVDMFVGWLDLQRIGIPQADELQRLLANLMTVFSEGSQPLPRLWYFPAGVDGMLVATGDSHGNPVSWIEDSLRRVERHGGRMSVYYTPPVQDKNPGPLRRVARDVRRWAGSLPVVGPAVANPFAPPAVARVSDWRARGHEFGIHPCVEEGIDQGYRRHVEQFKSLGYDPVPPTVRTHRVLWKGWVETARVQAAHGLRMNLDYYHTSPALRKADGRWVYGHFTGSALPMRFVDEQGRIVNVYQQPTQLVDEHLLKIWDWGPRLSGEQALAVSRDLIGHSLDCGYGPIVAQFHVDGHNPAASFHADASEWAEGTLDYAVSRGIPVWSAEQWLAFVEARHDAAFGDVRWDGSEGRLTFNVESATPSGANLAVMLPLWHGGAKLCQAGVDGTPVERREKVVAGIAYALIPVPAARHQLAASYAPASSS